MSALLKFHRLSERAALWSGAAVLAFALFNITILIKSTWTGAWIQDLEGHILQADFVSFWSTSRMLQTGLAHQVYDWTLHHAAEVDVLGPSHKDHFPWLNPPTFLLVIAPLALLPYSTAFLVWVAATFTAYTAATRTIFTSAPQYWILIGACAFPATLASVVVGQNGLLTGALVGSVLGLLERRPVLAGILLGLLTYKPQFGILFPIALVAAGQWRVIAAASATALLLAVATAALFGLEVWLAFWNSIPVTQESVLMQGQMGLHKLQSVYGAILWLNGSITAAFIVQTISALSAAIILAWVWHSRASMEVKAAALGTGILFATPYAFIYDLPILAVPIAFLTRAGIARGFTALEIPLMLIASLLVFAFVFIKGPMGLAAGGLITLAILQRAIIESREASSPSNSALLPVRVT